MISTAIIGAGLIGAKRAKSLPKVASLTYVCDIDKDRAGRLAKEYNAIAITSWQNLANIKDIEAVIICTTNNFLSPISKKLIQKGKHILMEKPGGMNPVDFNKVVRAFGKNPVVVRVGYNHRYHPAIKSCKKIIDSGKFGEVLFMRGKYGHGGRPGYEKEWRFDPRIAGGGEVIDQGSHLIDLVNFFIGECETAIGFTNNFFWKAKLEDSGFFILKNQKGQIVQLSASAVEWKNTFVFEIMLQKAKLQINGIGKSYGKETLTIYEMKPEMGPPKIKEIIYPETDESWQAELEDFFQAILKKNYSDESILNAKYVLDTVKKIYAFDKKYR